MDTATKQQKKVPELRFPEFKEDWIISTLGKESTFHDEKRIPLKQADREKRDGPYRYYGASGVIDYIDDYLFDGDYVLLGEDGANITDRSSRLAFVVSGKFWVNNHAHVIEAKASQYFLAEYLESLRYDKYNSGTAQPKLNSAVCKKIKIVIPSAEEQQKIADFLGSVDAWLDNLHQQKTALETYKRGMMQKLFTQQVRFKNENCKEFPKWQEKKLGEVFSATRGSGISKDDLDNDGANECILYGELYTTYTEVVSEVKSRTNISTGVRSKVGDVLIPCSTTTTAIDLANITALNKKDVLLGGDITVLRGKEAVNNIFYAYYLSNNKKNDLAKYGQGVTIIHIYYGHFKDMLIDVPSLVEQQKIADFLTAIDQTITAKAEEITKVEQWKKGLMQKMFV